MRRTIVIAFLSLAVPVAAWAKGSVAPIAVAPAPAPATGRVSAVASGGPTAGTTSSSAGSFNGTTTTTQVATSGANGTALPPPPPQSVTQSAAQQGVPASETPQPLATDSTGNGFSPQLNNQIRPSAAGNTATLTGVQASLAAGGLYSGPIDGSNSAALRASISEYQQLQNLPATGNLDAETLARINRTPATGAASNGATSTSGAATNASGFSSSVGLLPAGTPSAGSGSPVITSQPFPLSVNVNMSPYPPAGTTMQP